MESGVFYYKKATGVWSDAILFLIKQGVYDWSPDYIKRFLEEPDSKEFLVKVQGNTGLVKTPSLEVISFVEDSSKHELKPIKKNQPVKVAPIPKKTLGNVYEINSKKTVSIPPPQFSFIL